MKEVHIRSKEDVIEHLSGKTDFEKRVLVTTYEIPKGKVSTYKRVAQKIGRPRAYRAVGNALHKNPLAPVVPCHRVVRSDGRIAGETGSVETRKRLLMEEGVPIDKNRVRLTKETLF